MIKRLIKIAQAEIFDFTQKNKREDILLTEPASFDQEPIKSGSLAPYYANLEIPVGSCRGTVKKAWKTQMKKYHPDMKVRCPLSVHMVLAQSRSLMFTCFSTDM